MTQYKTGPAQNIPSQIEIQSLEVLNPQNACPLSLLF